MRIRFDVTVETACLAAWEGGDAVYTDKIESCKPNRSRNPIGTPPPLGLFGNGEAILAAEYVRPGGQARNRVARFTGVTITSVAASESDMERTRQRGHAVNRGEFRKRVYIPGSGIVLPDSETNGAPGCRCQTSIPR